MATMMVQEWKLLEQLGALSISDPKDSSVMNYTYMRMQLELFDLLKT